MNTNVQVIGLIRLGIKLESTAQETDLHTTRPSVAVLVRTGTGSLGTGSL